MLTPALRLALGDHLYSRQVAGLRLRRARLPATDRLEAWLPAGVPVPARPGDPVTLHLDGGEGEVAVFTGRLSLLRRRLDGIELVAEGGAARLARQRPVLSLSRVTAGEAIRRLADSAGVLVAEVMPGPLLTLYAADGRATALAEIARLAAFSGAAAHLDGQGRLCVPDPRRPTAPFALRYGREILEAEASEAEAPGPTPVVMGEGGAPGGPQARWIMADFHRGSPPAEGTPRLPLPEIRTRADALAAAQAVTDGAQARARPVRLTTFLLPALAPGRRLSIADMPGSVPLARAQVHQVLHSLAADGMAVTRLWGTGFEGAGMGAGALP